VVSAKVQTDDQHWMALDARYLKGYQRMLGGLYQSVLRNELAHMLGVEWSPIEHGQAEMLGIPAELRDEFSKRSVQVDLAVAAKRADFIDRQGREPNQWELAALKREAAADTRSTKTGNPVTELTTRWARDAAALGWTGPDLLTAAIDAGTDRPTTPPTVDLSEIIAALSTGGSTWNRADVASTVCDLARPNPDVDGQRWAAIVERVTDEVIARCVELDPAETAGPRRRSDGRSMWLEPIAPHITTDAILRDEELILSWALDAQAAEPRPSWTVGAGDLDALQADAAAAVAGHDRLVLVGGPAGTGKTTMLRAAVDDLHQHNRQVFGVAPSAKAARVLERETGIHSDTLAKLLHEWHRPDRPPAFRYQLALGTTVVVDEAGMVSTPALARLTTLATAQGWRLALVGDPHQLQAVGRGGLFHELCATGRAHELQRIHRFTAEWEAAASLQLRHGDPRGWDAYIEHGRVLPGTFDEHLITAAHRWLTVTAAGGTVSVIAATNEHVDALNAAIQRARVDFGQLNTTARAPIGGGEQAMIGDHVVTRRNDRQITTGAGEPIRNRELWTVAEIGYDGSLTVTSNRGHGTAVLPAGYAREHVRLGYAATEHGVQGDTTTVGIELASAATTRRGAYVGVTRGCDDNTVLVVTESRDLDEARDLLDRIITVDCADVPATTQRRELAAADRSPRAPAPRCAVPDWLEPLRADLTDEIDAAEQRGAEHEAELRHLRTQLSDAEGELTRAQRRLDPYRPSLDDAAAAVRAAQQRAGRAHNQTLHLKGRHRRAADRDHNQAQRDLTSSKQHEAEVKAVAAPAQNAVNDAIGRIHELRRSITTAEIGQRWDGSLERADELRSVLHAVDEWQRWASGKPMRIERIASMADALCSETGRSIPTCVTLADALPAVAKPERNLARQPVATSLEIDL
jgi:hypothetical protein